MLGSELEYKVAYSPSGVGALPQKEISSSNITFPSEKLAKEIAQLPQVTALATDLKTKSSEQIYDHAVQNSDLLVVDVSFASADERMKIREAASFGPRDIGGVTHNPTITILGDRPDDEPPAKFSKESMLLRSIVEEFLGPSEAANIGQAAFRRFIKTLFEEKNHEWIEKEWNGFIVGHNETGKVTTPLGSHHLHNLSLLQESEGEDSLRDQVISFVSAVMDEHKDELDRLFKSGKFLEHKAEDSNNKKPMNNPHNRSLAFILAEFSNFIRGGVWYKIRMGEKFRGSYYPRVLAADIISDVTDEVNQLPQNN